jgi:hypothetical protein
MFENKALATKKGSKVPEESHFARKLMLLHLITYSYDGEVRKVHWVGYVAGLDTLH